MGLEDVTADEWWSMAVSAVVVVIALVWWLDGAFPRPLASFNPYDDWDRKVVELERERVQAGAKGLAGTAAGFLVSLLTAALTTGLPRDVSTVPLVGCAAGAVGALLLAASLSSNAGRFVRNPTGTP